MADSDDLESFNINALGLPRKVGCPTTTTTALSDFRSCHLSGPSSRSPRRQSLGSAPFRADTLRAARQSWGVKLGDEEIVWGDKVILVRNGRTSGWDGRHKQRVEEYLANGEIGVAAPAPKAVKNSLNVAFANRPDVRFAYRKSQFGGGSRPLELAYALTVHKAQGSEFGVVYVILPKQSRLMTRELLYTALTRSRDRLVLLIEGTDPTFLYDLTRPERSETARRNTNLFVGGVRRELENVPYAEHLVHRTVRGELVRASLSL